MRVFLLRYSASANLAMVSSPYSALVLAAMSPSFHWYLDCSAIALSPSRTAVLNSYMVCVSRLGWLDHQCGGSQPSADPLGGFTVGQLWKCSYTSCRNPLSGQVRPSP